MKVVPSRSPTEKYLIELWGPDIGVAEVSSLRYGARVGACISRRFKNLCCLFLRVQAVEEELVALRFSATPELPTQRLNVTF